MIKTPRRQLIVGTILAVLISVSLVACGSASPPPSAETYAQAITVPMPDGRQVICIVYDDGSYGTELSCDWDHAV
jgi:hypothetical protein